MKHITEISKTLATVVTLLASVWFFGEPFLEDYVNHRVEERVISADVLVKAMNSPYMIDFQREQKRKWEDENLNKESGKIKFSTSLVSKTGMNRKAMEDTLSVMIKIHCKNKDYVTRDECIFNSKRYGRGVNNLIPM